MLKLIRPGDFEVKKDGNKLNFVVYHSPWVLSSIHKAFTGTGNDYWFWNWTGDEKLKKQANALALLHGNNFSEEPPLPEESL